LLLNAQAVHVDPGALSGTGPFQSGDPPFHRCQKLTVKLFHRGDERTGRHCTEDPDQAE
jgi:hypothetical protein